MLGACDCVRKEFCNGVRWVARSIACSEVHVKEMACMTTLTNPPIGPLLHRLFASAEQNDEKVMATWRAKNEHRREQISSRQRAEELSDAYLPISPEVGRLLYVLARNKQARTIVEFGTSFGISTIYLGAAVRDNRNGGRVITTELSTKKTNCARQNIAEAGLSDIVEILRGRCPRNLARGSGRTN